MLLIRNQRKTNREMIDFTTETQRTRRQKYNPQITTGDSRVTRVEDIMRTAVFFRPGGPAELRNRNLRNLRILFKVFSVSSVSLW